MPLNIEVNADYRLTSDERNIVILKRHIVDPTQSPQWPKLEAKGADPTPRTEYREVAYRGTITSALAWIRDQQVRDSNAGTLDELLGEIQRFNQEIEALKVAE